MTGRLATLSHSEFAALVQAHGAAFQSVPTRTTSLLVLGQLEDLGDAALPRSLILAQRYRAAGYPIVLYREEEFLLGIELDAGQDSVRARFTIRQLGRILSVPEPRLRSWARAGLIEPVEFVHRLALFDFDEAAQAKRLCELIEAGASVQDIQRGLKAMVAWLGSTECVLVRLSLPSRRRLVVRMEDGQLAETTGQLLLDFDKALGEPALLLDSGNNFTADDWFNLAVDAEDAGDYAQARGAYSRAIELDATDPVLHFNLGNVLYELGEQPAAAAAFQ